MFSPWYKLSPVYHIMVCPLNYLTLYNSGFHFLTRYLSCLAVKTGLTSGPIWALEGTDILKGIPSTLY